jgi:hypothetical protein
MLSGGVIESIIAASAFLPEPATGEGAPDLVSLTE